MKLDPCQSVYFDTLDHLANLEFKAATVQQGWTKVRYETARRHQGNHSLVGAIAGALWARLSNGTVILSTGTGNPVWLPYGETDGPSGVAVLARVLGGLGVRCCVVSEARFLPGIEAALRAAGNPMLPWDAWRQRRQAVTTLAFPTGPERATGFVADLMAKLPDLRAAFFIEKPGPNRAGVFHNSRGEPKDGEWVGHLQLLAVEAQRFGVLTAAIGDGGNEIGFGTIRDVLADIEHPYARDCGCPCSNGLLDDTPVDYLLPAAVSNWGAYAVAAGLAMKAARADLMPDWSAVQESITASVAAGAYDGYSGLAVTTVDGTSLEINRSIYQLMLETLQLALASPDT